jgi:hypothetical protein
MDEIKKTMQDMKVEFNTVILEKKKKKKVVPWK